MDRRDVSILRELSKDKVIWWGSTDPRTSASVVAKRLRIPVSTVRDRLRAWERSGFLAGTELVPSPVLFGAQLAGTSVRVTDPRLKADVLADVGLVEGSLTAMDLVGPWFALVVANPDAASLERTRRLIGRLRGVAEVAPCVPVGVPACKARPTALDWRILAQARQMGKSSITRAASQVGISTKTFTRRYEALIRAQAVWVVPLWDFTKLAGSTVARYVVELEDGADHRDVSALIWKLDLEFMEVFTPGGATPGAPRDWIEVWASLRNAAESQDAENALSGVRGAARATTYFPRRFHAYGAWFDARLSAAQE